MRAKKLRTKVVGLVAAVMVVGAPLTAWAIDVAGGDLYYNGGQTDTIVYSELSKIVQTPRAGLFVPPLFYTFLQRKGRML